MISSYTEKTSPRTVDGRPLTITRPTPPSRLVLGAGSREPQHQQPRLTLSWSRMSRSQSLDNERRHVPRHWQMSRLLADDDQGGLVVCVSRGCSADSPARHSRVAYCDNSLPCDDRLSCQPRNRSSVSRRHPRQTADDTSPRRFIVDDVQGRQGQGQGERQSRLIVDYDDDERQLTTHTQTETSLVDVQRPDQCSPTSDDCQCHEQQRGQESSKNRLTLSCVGLMADFSGLLRRMRRLRVGRVERQHETRV